MKDLIKKVNYRYNVKNNLNPKSGLIEIISDDKKTSWSSSSENPYFILKKNPKFTGWYMLEVIIDASDQYLDGSLCMVLENGATKKHNFLIVSNRITKRVILIPKKIQEIRFIPAEKKLQISVKSMFLVKLTASAAYQLMYKKLLTYYPNKNYKVSLNLWRHYENLHNQQHKSETDYSKWIKSRELNQLKKHFHIHESENFNILIYCWENTCLNELRETIKSIKKQTYPRWELFLITKYTSFGNNILSDIDIESNIRIISLLENEDLLISDLLERLTAQYFMNLEIGSILSPHALSIYSRTLKTLKGKSDLYYSDHDYIDSNGKRYAPQFKPDWSPDLILSTNYIGNNVVINRELLVNYGHITIDAYSMWVYGLLLEKTSVYPTPQHIPEILIHERSKEYLFEKTKKNEFLILEKYLRKHNISVKKTSKARVYRVVRPMLNHTPLVSIIIPTRDQVSILKRAIESIISKTTYPNYEIIVVNNQSKNKETKNYLDSISVAKNITVLEYNRTFNYSAINNYAVCHAKGELINLLNNDTEIINPGWLTEMTSHARRQEVGCVGAKLLYPDGRIQHGGVIIGLSGCAGHAHKFYPGRSPGYMNRLLCTQNYSAVTGACLLLRKELFLKVGGLNEKELSVAFNDVDLCLKIQKLGYRNIWTPWALLYHHESLSRGQDNTRSKRNRLTKEIDYMKKTWNTATLIDPYYHKNLTRLREDFSLGL